jgi:hypothetical protein
MSGFPFDPYLTVYRTFHFKEGDTGDSEGETDLNQDLFKEELVSTGGVVALYVIYVFKRNVRKFFFLKLNLVCTIEEILLHLETMLYVGWRTMLASKKSMPI